MWLLKYLLLLLLLFSGAARNSEAVLAFELFEVRESEIEVRKQKHWQAPPKRKKL